MSMWVAGDASTAPLVSFSAPDMRRKFGARRLGEVVNRLETGRPDEGIAGDTFSKNGLINKAGRGRFVKPTNRVVFLNKERGHRVSPETADDGLAYQFGNRDNDNLAAGHGLLI